MVKRYFYSKRPNGITKEEQAKTNQQNWDEYYANLIRNLQGGVNWLQKREEERWERKQAFEEGEIAFSCEELSFLEFDKDYTIAKYDGKEVKFRKGGFENEMLGILSRAIASKVKTVTEEQLAGSLERATGKNCIYKTVRNTRDRLNAKFQSGLGLSNVVKSDNGEYELEERYLRLPKK